MKKIKYLAADGHMHEPRIMEVSDDVAKSLLANDQFRLVREPAPDKADAPKAADKTSKDELATES